MKKSLKWKSKVNNLNSKLCMASEIENDFQDEACCSSNTHSLLFLKALHFTANAKQHVVVINISLI